MKNNPVPKGTPQISLNNKSVIAFTINYENYCVTLYYGQCTTYVTFHSQATHKCSKMSVHLLTKKF